MALTTFEEIKQELIDNEATEDDLSEFADGYVPVYTNQVIEEWQQMPSDYDDISLAEGTIDADATIVQRMMSDLWRYYSDLTSQAYAEIEAEREEIDE